MEKKIDCYENQVVDHVSWPFYRYTALLPEQIGGDMFVWLFLSLCVYVNETNGHSKDAYPKETVDTVRRMLTEKFSSVIDGQTLDKIQANAERDFVKDGKIKEETFSFLSTYENLFSDKLEKKYVFQDAITGEIVPNFDDHLEVDDGEGEGKAISERSVKSPTKLSIKKAYKLYSVLKKHSSDAENIVNYAESKDYFSDPEAETYLSDEEDDWDEEIEESPKEKNNSILSGGKYSVILLDGSRVSYKLDIPLKVQDDSLIPMTPFSKITSQWMLKCMEKARNVSDDLKRILDEDSGKFLNSQDDLNDFLKEKGDDVSYLGKLAPLYRIAHNLHNKGLDGCIRHIHGGLESNDVRSYYSNMGNFLEGVIENVKYPRTKSDECRTTTNYSLWSELDNKFTGTGIEYLMLKTDGVFKDWKNMFSKDDNRYNSFKAGFLDIILKSNLVKSRDIYPAFVADTFSIYNKRNAVSHFNNEVKTIDENDIDVLIKVTQVLSQLF